MSPLMKNSDFAISTFGQTAYELAFLGVPTIYLCHNQDDSESAAVLVNEGFGLSLGSIHEYNPTTLIKAVKSHLTCMCSDYSSPSSRHIFDGLGVQRIATNIMTLIEG